MKEEQNYRNILKNKTVLVLAEVAEESTKKGEDLEVAEALVSLTRAVLASGGKLKVCADPALALICSMVAGEYSEPQFAESFAAAGDHDQCRASHITVIIDGANEKLNDKLKQLQQFGYISVSRHPKGKYLDDFLAHAVVCIGGTHQMEKILNGLLEYQQKTPIFAITETGGYTRHIVERSTEFPENGERIIAFDTKILKELEELHLQLREEKDIDHDFEEKFKYEAEKGGKIPVIPFALIMQCIVDKIASGE